MYIDMTFKQFVQWCNVNAGLYSGGIGQNLSNYCHNCGAKMDVERKDE